MHHKAALFLRAIALLGLVLIIAACVQTPTKELPATPTIDSAHLTAFAQAQATYSSLPTPTPTATATPPPLGAVPSNCTPGPVLHPIFSSLGSGIGQAPLWVFGFDGPHPVLRIPTSYDTYVAPYGWTWKLIWEVGPHFSSNITLRGKNLSTGAPLWFQFLNDPYVTTAILDPHHPDHPVGAAEGYSEWGSYIFIPIAGCYQIEATWAGGQWSFPFAAGRQ